ncbi:MAG: o-succinylbenzoate synthase [Akkermansia sp.]|nr:o-succinylbenzoate synthase [Akkermansia sp.]
MQFIKTAPLLQFPLRIALRWQQRVLHFRTPATTSRGALSQRCTFIIEAACANGTGYGECCVMPGLLPELTEPQLQYWCEQVERQQSLRCLSQAPSPIRFGLETAVIAALNGGLRRWNTPFSRGEEGIPIHGLIWMADIDTMLRKMHDAIRQGFTCLKMKVGAHPFEQELQMLNEARSAFPGAEIRVDANGAFNAENALAKLEALANSGISCIEQPIPPQQWQHMAELCRQSPLPIALDEELIHTHNAEKLLDTLQPQAIVIKPSLHGGLLAAETWAKAAAERHIAWWVNSALESRIGLTALAEWCGYAAPRTLQGLGTGKLFYDDMPAAVQLAGAELRFQLNQVSGA